MSESPTKPIVELAAQSRDTTNAAFDVLLPEVAKLLAGVSNPQAAMGVVQALYRIATAIAYTTIGTPLDVRMRQPEDASALAAAHWRAATHLTELVMHELKRQGLKVPPEMVRVHNAAPPSGDVQAVADATSNPHPQQLAEQYASEVAGDARQEAAQPAAKQEGPPVDIMRINSRGGSS